MTYIPDLATKSYAQLEGPVRAIGWLEASSSFPRGKPDPEFVWRLLELIEYNVGWMAYLGMHWCSICASEDKIGPDPTSSQSQLYVSAADCVYEAPIWIGHYVLAHHYLPPDEFRAAVMACPKPGSEAYKNALLRHVPSLRTEFDTSFGLEVLVKTLLPDAEGTWSEYVKRHEQELATPRDGGSTLEELFTSVTPPPVDVEQAHKELKLVVEKLLAVKFDGNDTFQPSAEIGEDVSPYDPRRFRDARTRQQRIAEIVEREGGLGNEKCLFRECENFALSGRAICVEHMYARDLELDD